MSKFRKKPGVVEAFQITDEHLDSEDCEWEEWAQDACNNGTIELHGPNGIAAKITTLEGIRNAAYGDWIVRGIKGEIYPCKPDIFKATYEPADDEN